ncbi:hypothetical protein VAZ01S_090_00040 [Vibrio azureus NBRC 104587]|uniref:Uncharacterized protein n=1 Tax=Vibrio azureus NBRC 104587 TaxID=1219077 RepID=U3CHQ0_9VIBR|nr:hypothetical protein VAZ01S_090_00040 [Vibrio azureus NBRC 104587]
MYSKNNINGISQGVTNIHPTIGIAQIISAEIQMIFRCFFVIEQYQETKSFKFFTINNSPLSERLLALLIISQMKNNAKTRPNQIKNPSPLE